MCQPTVCQPTACQTDAVRLSRRFVVAIVATAIVAVVFALGVWAGATLTGGTGTSGGSDGAGDTGGSGAGTNGNGNGNHDIPEDARNAVVDYVHDGDTLFLAGKTALDDRTKVRLLGIDTPEIGEHAECYGDEATALLRELLPEGTAVHVLADVQPLDKYGRSLLFVYREDGMLVNLELIERGAAEAVVLPPNLMLADELEAAEDRAQAAGLGMWGAC